MRVDYWEKVIGPFPDEGFFLKLSPGTFNDFLELYYKGSKFRELIQCGGEKPPQNAISAYVGCVNVDAIKDPQRVKDFMQRCTQAVLERIAALSR